MTNNIPSTAFKVGYDISGRRGIFHVWITKGGRYQWDASGNCGEEPTLNEAIASARLWVINQIDKKKES